MMSGGVFVPRSGQAVGRDGAHGNATNFVYIAPMTYVYLFIAIASEVCATTFLKLSEGFTKPMPLIVTALGYGLAFYFLSLTLKTIPTGVAYAIWSGVGIVLIAAIAWLFQGQRLDAAAVIGIALIIAGIVVMTALSKAAAH